MDQSFPERPPLSREELLLRKFESRKPESLFVASKKDSGNFSAPPFADEKISALLSKVFDIKSFPERPETKDRKNKKSLEVNKAETSQVNNNLKGKIYKGQKGEYQILDSVPIGEGATSIVKKAAVIDEQGKPSKEIVAIKIFNSSRFDLSHPVYKNRVVREKEHGPQLNHDNLIKVIDYGVTDDENFLVMEYINGESLKKCIFEKKKFHRDEKVTISSDIIKGLKEIHDKKFVHRDLKPSNILIIGEGKNIRAKICDYGLLKHKEDSTETTTTDQAGSLNYMSLHKKEDPANANQFDDIYSLCLCLYEIFSGKEWKADTAELDKEGELGELIIKIRHLDIELDKLYELRVKYEKEQETYSLEKIQEIIKKLPVEPPESQPPLPQPPPVRIILFTVFAVCCILGGYFYIDSLKYRLTINANPKDAQVLIVNHPEINYEPGMKVKKEQYNIRVSRKGFKTLDKEITVDRDIEESVQLKKPCLTIKTKPENAQVRIVNHPEMEYKPGMELEPEQYHIKVFSEGFKSKDLTITIKDRDIEQEVNLIKLYRLTIKTIPEDSQVEIVNSDVNLKNEYKPGMELKKGQYVIEKGDHVIKISYEGFKPSEKKITIPGDIVKEEDKDEWRLKEVPQLMDNAIDIPKEKFKFENKKYGMKFVYIPPGSFMTNPENTTGERQHVTSIDRGFYIQTTEVTQNQWEQVMKGKPPQKYNCGTKENCLESPVTHISWYEVRTFIERLNTEGLTSEGQIQYRLPTEAEWEYACRARTETPFSFGSSLSKDQANYSCFDENICKAFRVASFSPNNWGLYDMHGNVTEWCQDTIYRREGSDRIEQRVRRGGAWNNKEDWCRSDYRSGLAPRSSSKNLGFRLVMTREDNTQ